MTAELTIYPAAIACIDELLEILRRKQVAGERSPLLKESIDGALDERNRLVALQDTEAESVYPELGSRYACPVVLLNDEIVMVESDMELTEDAATLLGLLSAGDLLAGRIDLETLRRRYRSWWITSVAGVGHRWSPRVVDGAADFYFAEILGEIRAGRLSIRRYTGQVVAMRLSDNVLNLQNWN